MLELKSDFWVVPGEEVGRWKGGGVELEEGTEGRGQVSFSLP